MLNPSLSRRSRIAAFAGLAAFAVTALPSPAQAVPTPRVPPAIAAAEPEVAETLLDRCPVDGPSTFEDSWGWPRSGGRSHEGVDMIADRGTPIVAVRDGYAQFKSNRLGGRAIWLTAENGDKFYYAHLHAWEGESRDVTAGELIGYVGSTGNAGGSHLHFETLPGGNVENPFPHTLAACVPSQEELAEAVNELNTARLWTLFAPEN